MAVQLRNDELVELLRADFQSRYEPNFAARGVDSLSKLLPGIRGEWLGSEFTIGTALVDTSGGGSLLNLTRNGNSLYSYENLIPIVIHPGGVNDYFSRADEASFDISGTETEVNLTERGMFMGIWVKPGVVSSTQDIIGKWDAAGNQRSYLIRLLNTNVFRAMVSVDGTAETTIDSTVTVSADNWYFVMMTFDPSTRLAINVNNTITPLAAGVPASIFNSSADFTIAASHGGTNIMTGRHSAAWLGVMYLADYFTRYVWEQTRAMFGG